MHAIAFLIVFSLILAVLLALVRPGALQSGLVRLGAAGLAAGSIFLALRTIPGAALTLGQPSHHADLAVFGLDAAVTAVVLLVALRGRRPLPAVLALLQLGLVAAAEFTGHPAPAPHLAVLDSLSSIMGLIIGIVGGLICVHAVGYMRDYHAHHAEIADRRPQFFALFFLFEAAMFGLVFFDHLAWIFLCWEVTTLCSFFLIGYSGTAEARRNAFRALTLNLVGGLGFAAALLVQSRTGRTLMLSELAAAAPAVAVLPAALIAFAGVTKSAQLPFSSWLLGAMVAPTPVSALLHSSTMVKAGVYVIIRLAPALQQTIAGTFLSFVGAITFVLASAQAISQSNAKRVLAYSTIANLGLIVACAGAGNHQALWAAVLLVIFHAVSKALLFLAVGTVEHRIGSRDIEDMQGLIARCPLEAAAILIGIAGMFLAPFGMLISKWAALEALVRVNALLPILIAFGSAMTLFFWAKWMGKLLGVIAPLKPPHSATGRDERFVLISLAGLTVLLCAGFPLISSRLINPWLALLYDGATAELGPRTLAIMLIMLALVLMLPLTLISSRKTGQRRVVPPYYGGANVAEAGRFTASIGGTRALHLTNYYMPSRFGEERLGRAGILLAVLLLLLMLGSACL